MVLRAQWPLGTIAQFFHFVAEEKKDDKKTKAFYDWATTSIPVIIRQHSIVDWLDRSDEGLTLETSAFLPFTVANLRFQPSC